MEFHTAQVVAPDFPLDPNWYSEESAEPKRRAKRAIIFRPLFVYRQQEIKKQRLKEERQQQAAAQASQLQPQTRPAPQNTNYAPNYSYQKDCRC